MEIAKYVSTQPAALYFNTSVSKKVLTSQSLFDSAVNICCGTSQIAPDYYQIIQHPVDMSRIKEKIAAFVCTL